MNYIVFDLEFNQYFDFPTGVKMKKDLRCPLEIIQIGAVKLDGEFNERGRLDIKIKPAIYRRVHPFVEKLTRLSSSLSKEGVSFRAAYKGLRDFIGGEESVFGCWGSGDMRVLRNNISYYGMDTGLITRKYVNIQRLAEEYLGKPGNISLGLKTAVEEMNLPLETTLHDAQNDADYTAKVFSAIKRSGFAHCVATFSEKDLIEESRRLGVDLSALLEFCAEKLPKAPGEREKQIIFEMYVAGREGRFDAKKTTINQ